MMLRPPLRIRFLAYVLLLVPAFVFAQSADRRLFQDAENRFRSNDYEVALQKYDQLLETYPLSGYVPDSQFRRAVCLFRLDRPDEALEVFRLVEARYPSTRFLPFVPFWIGVISYNSGDYRAASEHLKR
jgi:tetratricopeptide (TPR) repeat protein